MDNPVTKIIDEVAEDIFCRYRDTCDDNCECEYIRSGNQFPLDKLF